MGAVIGCAINRAAQHAEPCSPLWHEDEDDEDDDHCCHVGCLTLVCRLHCHCHVEGQHWSPGQLILVLGLYSWGGCCGFLSSSHPSGGSQSQQWCTELSRAHLSGDSTRQPFVWNTADSDQEDYTHHTLCTTYCLPA